MLYSVCALVLKGLVFQRENIEPAKLINLNILSFILKNAYRAIQQNLTLQAYYIN